jgi:transketolase
MAIGMALGLRMKRRDRRVFVLLGDGECNEGSVWESVLLAGNLGLANLTCIVINNHSSTRDLGDLAQKLGTFGWAATSVNGRDHAAIEAALAHTDERRPAAVVADVG